MAGIVPSLFGPTPEDLMSLRRREESQAIQQAGATLGPRGAAGAAFGTALGRGANALFGLEDPEIKKATAVYKVLTSTQNELGADINDPAKFYGTLYQKFKEAGIDDMANKIMMEGYDKVNEYNKAKAVIRKEERAGMTETQKLIEDIATAKKNGNKEAEDLARARLSAISKENMPNIEASIAYLRKKEAEGTITKTELVELDKLKQDKLDIQKAGAPRTTIEGPKAGFGGAETLINEQTKLLVPKQQTLANAEGSAQNALDLIKSGDLIQGTAADGRAAFGTFLETLGLGSDANKVRVSKSSEFEATMAGQVMSTIKALGANPSNSDREFAKKTIAGLGNTKEAAQAIAEYVLAKIKHERTQVDENLRFNANVLGGYAEGKKPSSTDVFTPKAFMYEKPQSTKDVEWLRTNKTDILTLGNIPLAQRTEEQQAKLQKALDIMKATGVNL